MRGRKHPVALKVEAIRRVICEGRSVRDVANEMQVSEGSLFFWLRRYREFASRNRAAGALVGHVETASRNAISIIGHRPSATDVASTWPSGTLAAFLRNRRR